MSGEISPQHSGPSVPIVLTEAPQAKGETPPQGRVKRRPQDTEKILTTPAKTSPHNKGKKRPQAPDCEGAEKTRTKQGEVLPKDKRVLEATSSDSSTESDEGGAVFASSSTTPWQRRVSLRTASAAKDKTQDPSPVVCDEEEDMAEASEFPTRRTNVTWLAAAVVCSQVPVEGYAEDPAVPVELYFNG